MISSPLISSSLITNSLGKIPSVSHVQNDKQLRKQTNSFEALILQIILDTSMKGDKNI